MFFQGEQFLLDRNVKREINSMKDMLWSFVLSRVPSGGGVLSVCLSTRAEMKLVGMSCWWEYIVYRVLGRIWQAFYEMSLLCGGIYISIYLYMTRHPPGSDLQPPARAGSNGRHPHQQLGEHFTPSDCTHSGFLRIQRLPIIGLDTLWLGNTVLHPRVLPNNVDIYTNR